MTLHYQPGVTPAGLAAAHAEYQARHAAPFRATWRPFANDRAPERPLRLGLVSPDFGRHPVGYLSVRAVEALARRGCAVARYPERVLRLPGGYASYDPPAGAPEPGPVPALESCRVTFGCFNNPAKLSAPALDTFAAVLRRVPNSRLVLKYRGLDDPAVADRL